MTIQRFILSLGGFLCVHLIGVANAQQTVTDQYGTEILVDVLPPTVQNQVFETQTVLDTGGGEGPIAVDKLGRFDLQSAPGNKGGVAGGTSSDEYLVNQLLGVVLLPRPGDVRPDGWPGVEGIWHDFDDFPRPVGISLQNYIGRPVSLGSLDQMVKDVIVAYREGDRPVVDVLLPEQDITSGVVQLVVIESELSRIRVEGVDADTEEFIRSQMRVKKGEVIRSSEVLRDLSWVNRSPYRKVDMVYAPGYEFGTTDIILKSYQERANWFYTGYEDSGVDFLGQDRIIFGFNLGDVFGPNRTLSYQYTGDLDNEHVQASSLVYTQALPWRHWVTVLASYVQIDSDPIPVGPGAGLDSDGDNIQLSARYSIPLDGTANRQREMDFGFDWKSNGSNLEFVDSQNIGNVQLFGTRVEIFQFSLGYNETIQGQRGVTQFDLRGFYSPGGLNGHNSDFTFQQSRALSSADYFYGTGSIEHQRRLRDDWSARMKVTGQISNSNLQASEQLGAGGYDTVRGFDQRVARGDHGFWTTFELYTPELSFGRIFDWENETDSLRFLGFFDAASLGNDELLVGEPSSSQIGSVGMGLRWNYSDWFKFRLDYGYPVFTENVIADESGRFHIGATATF
ncbi:MAG: ShlB/FhaC/HecB family hemolysin secretion/activation protein [Verrucomicrobiales bacterium]|nr:ShlB/FhaC/HecB family hemolysin secretion/activation protein [Verrucomicrobiales bacterium]